MPGSAAGRGKNPFHLTVVELLLQGHPGEFLGEWYADQVNAHVDEGVSDRELMRRAAQRWLGNPSLTAEERDRIHAVWIEGTYRTPLNITTGRRDELRGLLVRARVPA